jgi:histidine ammonia-lyase
MKKMNNQLLSIQDVAACAFGGEFVALHRKDEGLLDRIAKNHGYCKNLLSGNADIYGATTGFGKDNVHQINQADSAKLQYNLTRFHGIGLGKYLSEAQCAATMLVRLGSLSQAVSGIRPQLVEHLSAMLEKRVIAAIPCMGSVGASGDLTPLSYVAATMMGERKAYWKGQIIDASVALKEAGLSPYKFEGREALSIMNGTSMMTAIASLSIVQARRIADLACELGAIMVETIGGRSAAFHPSLHARKPHAGQQHAADKIFSMLVTPEERMKRKSGGSVKDDVASEQIQDVYSVRCMPQVIGPLYDALEWATKLVETEMNSANDNPLFISEEDVVLHGGHFFGGHVALACDTVKIAVCNVANLLERQLAYMMSPANTAKNWDHNLVQRDALGSDRLLHHGFKATHITASAIAAEVMKNSSPASVLSRPTESYNQDVVSMGSIASRDLGHVCDLTANLVAINAAALRQIVHIQCQQGSETVLSKDAAKLIEKISAKFSPLLQDRPLANEIMDIRDLFFADIQLGAQERQ